ncbi:MAG: hypothetical protein SGILL_008230 [Bacillariaceae sp.]
MVIDVDEFATINTNYEHSDAILNRYGGSRKPTIFESIQASPLHRNSTCVTMPRLRFGTHIDDQNSTRESWIPTGLDFKDSDFLTLQWKWRSPLIARKYNKLPKSMIDVSAIDSFDRQDTDMHRPVRSACPRQNLYIQNYDSPWVVHHYVGTREQFHFRKDARKGMDTRSEEKLQEYRQIRGAMEDSICDWLQEFVDSAGLEQAQKLLAGVGNVSFSE